MFNTKKVLSTLLMLALFAMVIVPASMAVPVNVTFDVQGATGTVPTVEPKEPGEALVLPGVGDLAKEGFEFKGWAEAEGSADEADAVAWDTYPDADKVLYAIWAPVTTPPAADVKVLFDANGGTGTQAELTGKAGDDLALPAVTFEAPEGKEFNFWGDTAEATEATTLAKFPDKDTTLFAIWKDKENTGGNTGEEKEKVKVIFSEDATGWAKDEKTGEVTKKTTKITAPPAVAVEVGSTVDLSDTEMPELPDVKGYVPLGWSTDPGTLNDETTVITGIKEDTTVFAIYLKDKESEEDGMTGGNTGGDNTGGDPGNTGGDPGNTGGDPGNTGGDPGNTGGDPGNNGGTTPPPTGKPSDTVLVPVGSDGNGNGQKPAGDACLPETGGVANVMPTLVGEILLIMGSGLAFGRKQR